MADWYYDDLRQVGLDFEDAAAVAAYDRNQGSSSEEDRALLDQLGVNSGHTLIDLGCGTGSLAIEAAKRCREAVAVDVSRSMLRFVETRAAAAGLRNLRTAHGGFLSYDHAGPSADFLVTKYALHHLPDFWKGVALLRLNAMLRPGGVLFLRDVVFSFPLADYRAGIDGWISRMAKPAGEGFTRADFATHVREEHSTFDWILEGLITRAGFQIEHTRRWDDIYADYTCRKPIAARTRAA
jgi:cyclopropane fatty-acyl-phospholipid synthase-like methyltransferase